MTVRAKVPRRVLNVGLPVELGGYRKAIGIRKDVGITPVMTKSSEAFNR